MENGDFQAFLIRNFYQLVYHSMIFKHFWLEKAISWFISQIANRLKTMVV